MLIVTLRPGDYLTIGGALIHLPRAQSARLAIDAPRSEEIHVHRTPPKGPSEGRDGRRAALREGA
jgi:sRNA-binding carbon storage regulator CsrA